MEFNKVNYPIIQSACENKQEIEFTAPVEITGFANSTVPLPEEWTAFPPAALPPKGYAQILLYAGVDIRGTFITLELLVHLDGGRILYRVAEQNQVAVKVTWQQPA